MKDYTNTPSFYNSEEVFKQYLGRTSYYLALQNALKTVIGFIKPTSILELGSGTGNTANQIAKISNESHVVAIDMRAEMIELGNLEAKKNKLSNIKFIKAEMHDYVKNLELMPEVTYMLYSFHHILDPMQQKIEFLNLCYNKMKNNTYLCIAEAFLPESTSSIELHTQLLSLWSKRSYEGYASTFWASLDGLTSQNVEKAKEIGKYSYKYEWKAGELVMDRDNEYLVSVSELVKVVKEIGFNIVICEPCNNVNDYLILLKK